MRKNFGRARRKTLVVYVKTPRLFRSEGAWRPCYIVHAPWRAFGGLAMANILFFLDARSLAAVLNVTRRLLDYRRSDRTDCGAEFA